MIDHKTDGIDHINIYSKGNTNLGRMLSHFYSSPFTHPEFGYFHCVEGFWYYISTGCCVESFRNMRGYEAKLRGKDMPRVKREDFQQLIHQANKCKIEQNERILKELINSTLTFKHYYVITNKDTTFTKEPKNLEWLCKMFEDLRTELKRKYLNE